jgi:hypothetical protein
LQRKVVSREAVGGPVGCLAGLARTRRPTSGAPACGTRRPGARRASTGRQSRSERPPDSRDSDRGHTATGSSPHVHCYLGHTPTGRQTRKTVRSTKRPHLSSKPFEINMLQIRDAEVSCLQPDCRWSTCCLLPAYAVPTAGSLPAHRSRRVPVVGQRAG